MTPRGPSASPVSTWHHRIGFLSPVSSSISRTRPATSGPFRSGPRWMSSTSRPTRTNASPTASTSVGRPSTWAASQDRGTRTETLLRSLVGRPDLHAEGAAEPHVALDHLAHVGQAVAELQSALQAHAEREARVHLDVDAAGPQDVRVDHAAATPLDPARAALLLREPHVHLGGRLGEGEERRAQAGAGGLAEHGAGGGVGGALEGRPRDALFPGQGPDLGGNGGGGG